MTTRACAIGDKPPQPHETRLAMDRLLGLAVFGEKVAARTYGLMADLEPGHGALLRKFRRMSRDRDIRAIRRSRHPV